MIDTSNACLFGESSNNARINEDNCVPVNEANLRLKKSSNCHLKTQTLKH